MLGGSQPCHNAHHSTRQQHSFAWFALLVAKVRNGPNWASIGFTHDAFVGVDCLS